METTITIDGRPVRFRATAAVPRLYRIKFRRDIIADIQAVRAALDDKARSGRNLPPEALELFENAAYIMAKHADQANVPASPEEWLDQFDTFSIYQIFPQLSELWTANLATGQTAKKKHGPSTGRSRRRC